MTSQPQVCEIASVGLDPMFSVVQETRRVPLRALPGTVTLQFEDEVASEHAVRLVNALPQGRAVCGFIYRPATFNVNHSWTEVNMFKRCAVCADMLDDPRP
jgi:hypothetical protein